MIVVGLDGYSRGWVAVRIDGGRRDLRLLSSISGLSAMKIDRAGIDMPIGPPGVGLRDCDLQARLMRAPTCVAGVHGRAEGSVGSCVA